MFVQISPQIGMNLLSDLYNDHIELTRYEYSSLIQLPSLHQDSMSLSVNMQVDNGDSPLPPSSYLADTGEKGGETWRGPECLSSLAERNGRLE
ncbi:hypothetical protein RRG08_004228 [Elysia crispata]|uniref:Uncharacterized protein n=1 Tax=Elysia crispata TaxID=231223 RepID=A0AAE0ZL86_9GAST|nr:hypothetical protein RRG08_004228 [Elysia crispata]